MKKSIIGYCEAEEKPFNPYGLPFLGKELSEEGLKKLQSTDYFIAIGNNRVRYKIQTNILQKGIQHLATNIIHSSAIISPMVTLDKGIMIAQNVVINSLARIEEGVVCNTSSVIEHEVKVGKYSFIGPNATLLGAVEVGAFSFVGANSVVKQGVKIGNNVTIGAGTVVIRDIPDNQTIVGNPQRLLKTNKN